MAFVLTLNRKGIHAGAGEHVPGVMEKPKGVIESPLLNHWFNALNNTAICGGIENNQVCLVCQYYLPLRHFI
jgi:hypothetical protein